MGGVWSDFDWIRGLKEGRKEGCMPARRITRRGVPHGRVDDQDDPRPLRVVLLDEAQPLAQEDFGLCVERESVWWCGGEREGQWGGAWPKERGANAGVRWAHTCTCPMTEPCPAQCGCGEMGALHACMGTCILYIHTHIHRYIIYKIHTYIYRYIIY